MFTSFRSLVQQSASLGLLVVFSLCDLISASAEDWPHWRGPDRNGISKETGWISNWTDSEPKVAWKTQVGIGFSAMSISDGRLVTMGHAEEKDTIYCFDAATGKPLWKRSYPAPLDDKYFDGGPTSTPTIDGDAVYAFSRQGDVFCLDAKTGKIRWTKMVQNDPGYPPPTWGFGASPFIHGDLLILNAGEGGLGLNKKTGETVWTSYETESGYSTPVPFKLRGDWFGVIGSTKHYLAFNLNTGKELWRYRWLTRYKVNAADPIIHNEHVLISTGYGKGSTLVKMGGEEPEEVWKERTLRSQFNSPVLIGEHLYGIDGDTPSGSLKCIEFMTGKELWSEESVGAGSLMAADGKLIALSETGELMIAPASPKGFTPTGKNQVVEGRCWTVPVLANGRIYCRNATGDLVCLDVRKQ